MFLTCRARLVGMGGGRHHICLKGWLLCDSNAAAKLAIVFCLHIASEDDVSYGLCCVFCCGCRCPLLNERWLYQLVHNYWHPFV